MVYKECLDYIRSDYYRITGTKNIGLFRMWASTLLDRGFHFLFWLRFSNCNNFFIGVISRLQYRILGSKFGISIQRDTKIGYGFKIAYGGPIVINASAVIGDNVDVYQYSTIRSSWFNGATIGDNVYIGPSVCIVENVKIGNGGNYWCWRSCC